MQVVSTVTRIPIKSITKKGRDRANVIPRHLYKYFSKLYTRESYTVIGGSIGQDHSSVSHSLRTVLNIIDIKEEPYYSWIKDIQDILNESPVALYNPEERVMGLMKSLKMKSVVGYYTSLISLLQIDLDNYIQLKK